MTEPLFDSFCWLDSAHLREPRNPRVSFQVSTIGDMRRSEVSTFINKEKLRKCSS
jgi:hypothetical protein